MAWKTLTKTIASANAEPLSATSIKCRSAFIQAVRGNSAAFWVGDANVADDQGIELLEPQENTQTPWLPLQGLYGNDIDLANVYVIGTTNDVVAVLYDEF